MFSKRSLSLLVVFLSKIIVAQQDANLTGWYGLRGGSFNHTLYVEGGLPTFNGDHTTLKKDNGFLWQFPYCQSFDTSKDAFSTLFTRIPETLDSTAVTSIGGALFASGKEFYGYGGISHPFANNDSAYILHAELEPPDSSATAWTPSWDTHFELSTVNNYVAWGAAVSVPSENLGFYFGGVRSATFGGISWIPDPSTYTDTVTNLSDTLITVDMTKYRQPTWTNSSLSDSGISSRSGASLVWIPKATRGLLLAIGGVPISDDFHGSGSSLDSEQETQISTEGPAFMTEVPVYDVDQKKWYKQKTTFSGSDSPPATLAQHCAVAVTQDDKTFHIYVYGGWNGVDTLNDEVWVLSVPSFTWFKAASGVGSHARRGHFCTAPTDNQLITIGGVDKDHLDLKSSIVDVFDMNNLTWSHQYNSNLDMGYIVPDSIRKQSYDASGAPVFASNMDSSLTNAMKVDYANSKALVKGYPYNDCNGTTKSSIESPPWKYPVIGAVVGVVVLAIAALLLWYFCRPAARKRVNRYSGDSSSSRKRLNRFFGRNSSPEMEENKPQPSVMSNEVFTPISPQQTMIYEADPDNFGYFKHHEIDSNPSIRPHRSPQSTAIGSPGSFNTPVSEVDGSPRPRHEMPSPPVGMEDAQSLRNHYMYPRNLTGQPQSVRSDSYSNISERTPQYPNIHGVSARAGPVSPYELPPNRSDEAVGLDPDANFKLENKDVKDDTATTTGMKSEYESIMAQGGSYSTNISHSRDDSMQSLPPQSNHHRNTSSLNSTSPLLPMFSPTEETNRATFPGHPTHSGSPTSLISPTSPDILTISPTKKDDAYQYPPVGQSNAEERKAVIARKSLPRHEQVLEQQRRKSIDAQASNDTDAPTTVAEQIESMGTAANEPKSAYDLNQAQIDASRK